jgi:hypothetical protein
MRRNWTRHSIVLGVSGLIYAGIGFSFIYAPGYVGKDPSLWMALKYLTLSQWGLIYLGVGFLATFAGTFPIGKKTWGYMALTSLSSVWAFCYVLSVVFGGAPKRTVLSALVWSLVAFLWWAVSGLLSPEHVKRMMRNDKST